MAEKEKKKGKVKNEQKGDEGPRPAPPDPNEIEAWLKSDPAASSEVGGGTHVSGLSANAHAESRLERIKQSHALLSQFSPQELKTLMNLKRNTSPKAWTLREDLVVLTLHLSNREIAEILKDRNKEAVKKRLQLLRSKGLTKRQPTPPTS